MLMYREKNNLFYKLHPLTNLLYISLILFFSFIFSSPIYLLGLFISVGLVIISSENLSEWRGYLKFSLILIAIIIVVNVIIVKAGSTVLYRGPRLPVLGRIRITMEALIYAVGMGIRLLVVISIFCFYTYGIHPDKLLKLFSRWGNKSVLVITLSTRLFPLMISDYKRISEVQRCRGVKLNTGSLWNKAKNMIPIYNVLLLSSLERSFQIAESMYARGYGSGKRSIYKRELFRPRDFLIIISLFLAFVVGVFVFLRGWSSYIYYPKLQSFSLKETMGAFVVSFILTFPALLNWGWQRCKILKLKI
ncbi:energy-coupling factor transport system permease protein [Caminicella sporogenes DSM 14501]|uniref:Energy-coupling factor transport system permease protein n=1 Tax=Caminicella sporogenes DSM 14501 TaxID=1121266 RepID=A0A1M6PDJ6_9FIRM|nr:energy-coupling factor transporter transmembrane component T [Caminicella sporogenes]RKD21440.1 hypothetical protein BET04_08355 [Caminicella sporogenes]WIF95419.1 energy-coupling factor transporter transmembrane component T [Caminicella sporogenes]SHK05994.1 energy-coupling factor transport system permease protein [Caminicella sporogenes DSM 14501]